MTYPAHLWQLGNHDKRQEQQVDQEMPVVMVRVRGGKEKPVGDVEGATQTEVSSEPSGVEQQSNGCNRFHMCICVHVCACVCGGRTQTQGMQ